MKKAIIIGAGPAGLTAAYELLKRTDIHPIILEKSEYIGGISRTIDYKGNRMDMGPHRFFSKSDRVMDWWLNILPLQEGSEKETTISYQNKSRNINSNKSDATIEKANTTGNRMLIIKRLTRIYFLRKFFAYPIQLSIDTLKTLGLLRTIRILLSFLKAKLFPRSARSLEDFIINQFGRELYLLFFKDYTEKVWGVPCHEISAEWGAQRIKGLSLGKAISQAVKSLGKGKGSNISQKDTETSLIEKFLYPKYGPGSLWEEVARQIREMGGEIYMNQEVQHIYTAEKEVAFIHTIDTLTGELHLFEGDYFISSMPVQDLISGMGNAAPANVREVAEGLQYRDFINVGILLNQLSVPTGEKGAYEKLDLKDNWIYIQERDVKVGRLMIYNNWGGGMIEDAGKVWIGMEYFCNKTDDFWALNDAEIQAFAIKELERMSLARVDDVLDITVRRMEKTYPAYFGTYDRFGEIRSFTDQFLNLFLVGRNGMHKYNNADHSMLTAIVSVDHISQGVTSKENIWAINTEQEYHEEKQPVTNQTQAEVKKRLPILLEPVWNNKWNRTYCCIALLGFLVQFILFKFKYPFANYMPDSYYYLDAAFTNADVNMWPVAYSKFLRLVSVFTHSDKVLTGLQYIFMQASSLVFLFTVLHFLRASKAIRNALCIFFLLNPLPLFVANYISADALFIGFSFLWLTCIFWIIYRPMRWQIILQGAMLLACFTLRYNAIYYPLLAIFAYSISKQSLKLKLSGISFGLMLILCSIIYTSQKMKSTMGQRQFSAFSGWQLANNALYMYEHVPPSHRKPAPARFAQLEKMVRQHIDTLQKVKFSHEDSVNGYFYLWSTRGPLMQYMNQQWKKDSTTSYFNRWAAEGPLYMDYALYLIGKYPISFLRNFLLPNSAKFAVPPMEFLGTYNMGADSVNTLAKAWFNYKSQRVQDHHKQSSIQWMITWYPVFSTLINLLLLIHLIGLFTMVRNLHVNRIGKAALLASVLWIFNLGFSVFASPIVLRYQLFPILICLVMALSVGQTLYKSLSQP